MRRIDHVNELIMKINNKHKINLRYCYDDYNNQYRLISNNKKIGKPISSLRELEKSCFLIKDLLNKNNIKEI